MKNSFLKLTESKINGCCACSWQKSDIFTPSWLYSRDFLHFTIFSHGGFICCLISKETSKSSFIKSENVSLRKSEHFYNSESNLKAVRLTERYKVYLILFSTITVIMNHFRQKEKNITVRLKVCWSWLDLRCNGFHLGLDSGLVDLDLTRDLT